MSARRQAERDAAYRSFADQLQALADNADFDLSARGWCYILEEHGLTKDQFDTAEARINTCRKEGWLPLDFTADDSARGPQGDDGARCDYPVPEELGFIWEEQIQAHLESYAPLRWVDFQRYYVEVGVEKVDLVGLNMPVCREFRAMVSNFRGDVDINAKARMYQRFQQAAERGQQTVLLLEGDHDPKGLQIHGYMLNQFLELQGLAFADGTRLTWDPRELIIVRFGLNADFITEQGLSRIPNLITGTGRDLTDPDHPDHGKPYVQDYLHRFCARDAGGRWRGWKCEANALVTRTDAGRELMRAALRPYVDLDGMRRYQEAVEKARAELRAALPEFLREQLAA
jgi:hypothetical protein